MFELVVLVGGFNLILVFKPVEDVKCGIFIKMMWGNGCRIKT